MGKESGVKITIVMAVYNMENTVERAMLSVLNQTYENRELIVMDGGSTDETVEVIKKYAGKLKHWVSAPDKGPSDAISKALSHAEGELIGFLGADDWYEPYALELVAKAYENTEADLYYGNVAVHSSNEVLIKDLSTFCPDKLYRDGTQWLGAVCAFTKKELLQWNYTKKNNVLHTDYLYFLRLYAENKKFVHIGSDRVITNFSIGGRTTRGVWETKKLREQFKSEYPQMTDMYLECDEFLEKECAFEIARHYLYIENYKQDKLEIDFESDSCILFGAGYHGIQLAKELIASGSIKVEYFVDNDKNKWGQYIEGIEVRSPESLLDREGKCVIVTPGPKYETQIMEQLHHAGVDQKNQIISYVNIALKLYGRLGEQTLRNAYDRGIIA